MLALPWRRFAVSFATAVADDSDDAAAAAQPDNFFTVSGTPVLLREAPPDAAGAADDATKAEARTGCAVWDGAVALAAFLDARPESVRGRGVVELGAGTALVSVAAALVGASPVVVTDLQAVLDAAAAPNVLANAPAVASKGGGPMHLAALDWLASPTSTQPAAALIRHTSVILAADVVWVDPLVVPLVSVVADVFRLQLSSSSSESGSGRGPEMWLAHQTRSLKTDELLFKTLTANNLRWSYVPLDEMPPAVRDPAVRILHITPNQRNV